MTAALNSYPIKFNLVIFFRRPHPGIFGAARLYKPNQVEPLSQVPIRMALFTQMQTNPFDEVIQDKSVFRPDNQGHVLEKLVFSNVALIKNKIAGMRPAVKMDLDFQIKVQKKNKDLLN